jgi:hypothetical protein
MAAPTQACVREESSCQPGAVHTWHLADITNFAERQLCADIVAKVFWGDERNFSDR